MRALTEEETRIFFEKLAKYIGKNIRYLIDRPDGEFCFRLVKDRVYYMSETLMKEAISCGRDELVSVGVCFGKFSKTLKFRLHITALPYIAQYIKYKVWIKPNGEMSYLYGNNVIKAHLGRITENTPKYGGVVMYNMSDVPLGFGVAAYSTAECRKVESTSIIAFHQADIGEYLRIEEHSEAGTEAVEEKEDKKATAAGAAAAAAATTATTGARTGGKKGEKQVKRQKRTP